MCVGKVPGGRCTNRDPYSGFEGAFRCLLEAGDIAFLKHTTVSEMINSKEFREYFVVSSFWNLVSIPILIHSAHSKHIGSVNADRFELLCKDGVRRPLSEYRQCNWGLVPSHALVTSSARSAEERKHYQHFLTRAVQLYSTKSQHNVTGGAPGGGDRRYEGFNRFDKNSDDKYYDQNYLQEQNAQNTWNPYTTNTNNNNYNNNPYDNGRNGRSNLDSIFTTERSHSDDNTTQLYEKFELFESERYGGRLNLMFQDAARGLVPIKEDDQSFAGYLGSALQQILEVRQCPVGRMTLCVTSDAEMDKCIKMRVKSDFTCGKTNRKFHLMQSKY